MSDAYLTAVDESSLFSSALRLGTIMKFYSRLTGLLGMLVAVPALAGIPDNPQQVQPLSVGARAARPPAMVK